MRERERLRLWQNLRGSRRQCYICRANFDHFLPYREGGQSPFTSALGVVGSDVENFYCPACACFDRERHLFMYFDALGLWEVVKGARVLHFAPEEKLTERIADASPAEHVKGDIKPAPGFVKIDVTAIDYPAEYFDLVICNHVLEHVADDGRAIAELYRVLKRGGRAVLQTPFTRTLANSFQDANINTDALRLRFYGEADHVRVYGQDLFTKLEAVGFSMETKRHAELFAPESAAYYGVNAAEDLILALKPLD